MEENLKRLTALMQDTSKREQVFSGDADQVLVNLRELGIELSREELEEFAVGFVKGCTDSEAELSEASLESVAGGRIGIGFFIGIGQGMMDKRNNTYSKPRGGLLYQAGYQLGSGVW